MWEWCDRGYAFCQKLEKKKFDGDDGPKLPV